MRSNLELFTLGLRPNMCKLKIINLKVVETILNYKFGIKHIDYL